MFCKKGILRSFTKLTGKHLCQRLFFNKIETLAQVFSCGFCEISKNTIFQRTPLVAAGMILIDLQKAIDTIKHEILLKKLKAIGFSDKCIRQFQPHLCERIFFTEIENQLSDYGKVSCGLPQGSIIGPLLFFPYVKEMLQACRIKSSFMYQ